MLKNLDQVDAEPIVDVHEAFAQLVAEAVTLKDVWAAHVAHLEQLRYEGARGTEQLRAEVALYERAMDRAGKLLTEWVRLGFDERRLALEEAQAELVVAALHLAAERAGLAPAVRQQVIEAWSTAVVELEKANAEPSKSQ